MTEHASNGHPLLDISIPKRFGTIEGGLPAGGTFPAFSDLSAAYNSSPSPWSCPILGATITPGMNARRLPPIVSPLSTPSPSSPPPPTQRPIFWLTSPDCEDAGDPPDDSDQPVPRPFAEVPTDPATCSSFSPRLLAPLPASSLPSSCSLSPAMLPISASPPPPPTPTGREPAVRHSPCTLRVAPKALMPASTSYWAAADPAMPLRYTAAHPTPSPSARFIVAHPGSDTSHGQSCAGRSPRSGSNKAAASPCHASARQGLAGSSRSSSSPSVLVSAAASIPVATLSSLPDVSSHASVGSCASRDAMPAPAFSWGRPTASPSGLPHLPLPPLAPSPSSSPPPVSIQPLLRALSLDCYKDGRGTYSGDVSTGEPCEGGAPSTSQHSTAQGQASAVGHLAACASSPALMRSTCAAASTIGPVPPPVQSASTTDAPLQLPALAGGYCSRALAPMTSAPQLPPLLLPSVDQTGMAANSPLDVTAPMDTPLLQCTPASARHAPQPGAPSNNAIVCTARATPTVGGCSMIMHPESCRTRAASTLSQLPAGPPPSDAAGIDVPPLIVTCIGVRVFSVGGGSRAVRHGQTKECTVRGNDGRLVLRAVKPDQREASDRDQAIRNQSSGVADTAGAQLLATAAEAVPMEADKPSEIALSPGLTSFLASLGATQPELLATESMAAAVRQQAHCRAHHRHPHRRHHCLPRGSESASSARQRDAHASSQDESKTRHHSATCSDGLLHGTGEPPIPFPSLACHSPSLTFSPSPSLVTSLATVSSPSSSTETNHFIDEG